MRRHRRFLNHPSSLKVLTVISLLILFTPPMEALQTPLSLPTPVLRDRLDLLLSRLVDRLSCQKSDVRTRQRSRPLPSMRPIRVVLFQWLCLRSTRPCLIRMSFEDEELVL